MKIYFELNTANFSNSYLLVNEISHGALLIDPAELSEKTLLRIEKLQCTLSAILLTSNEKAHRTFIDTIEKIYKPKIYSSASLTSPTISQSGRFREAGFTIRYKQIAGTSEDAIIYKIGNVLFTGKILCAGTIGNAASSYAELTLRANIAQKIFSEEDASIIMPYFGPPSSIESEKQFNIEMKNN